MRPIVYVTAVSLCMWCGIIWSAVAVTNELAPHFLHSAKHRLDKTIAKLENRVHMAFARTAWHSPA